MRELASGWNSPQRAGLQMATSQDGEVCVHNGGGDMEDLCICIGC
jgi:hypothetical protein